MSFGSFVVSDSFFDLLTEVSHLGLLFSVHIFSFLDEGSKNTSAKYGEWDARKKNIAALLKRTHVDHLLA